MPKRTPLGFRQAASRCALAAALLFALAPSAQAQAPAPASVTGRVTDGERGVAGITVTLISTDPAQRFRAAARARTDGEGRYLLQNVAPGRYQIMPYAPAFVVQGLTDSYPPGRPLMLLAGDEVKDIDFRVERGGVITGRVTDADGNPVISEAVQIAPFEVTNNRQPPRNPFDQRDQMTDDRGVYRIYGLQPGRYRVSVGQSGEDSGAVSFGRRKIFRRTYHPDVTDQAQARIVEVKAGGETENVDITLGKPLKTFKASGRFVSAETGQPVPNLSFGYGPLDPAGRRLGAFGSGQASNARGEFQTEGLAPGRYAVFNLPGLEVSEFYTEPASFEIVDADVTGLVVGVKRGASVSGVVQIEGVSDRALAARLLTQVRVYGWPETNNQMAPSFSQRPTSINPDGSFRIPGLRPGKLRLGSAGDNIKGLVLSRVEYNGANAIGGIDVAEGAQLTGVRMVLTYGTGVITGQTSFLNGAPQPGTRVIAQARRAGAQTPNEFGRTVEVDARGLFRIEGLPAGEYLVTVSVFGAGRMQRSEPQTVSLSDGGETRVTPVVDFAQPRRGDAP
ncbi:MAG TPA: carboxypeptidase-like regulatory domain-containing protein [Pyrinomonadaceae bacterium]